MNDDILNAVLEEWKPIWKKNYNNEEIMGRYIGGFVEFFVKEAIKLAISKCEERLKERTESETIKTCYSSEEINLFSDIASEFGFLEGFAFPSFKGREFTKEEMKNMRIEHSRKINRMIELLPNLFSRVKEQAKQEAKKEAFELNHKNQWVICQNCLSIANWQEQIDEAGNGGMGMCDCEYIRMDNGEPIYDRIYNERVQLTRELLDKHDEKAKQEGFAEALKKTFKLIDEEIDEIKLNEKALKDTLNNPYVEKEEIKQAIAYNEVEKDVLQDLKQKIESSLNACSLERENGKEKE